MSKLINYNQGETLATGFARPKVTSLYFDKIWLPKSVLNTFPEYIGIPDSVLLSEKNELLIGKTKAGENYYRHILPNMMTSGDLYKHTAVDNSEISLGKYYEICDGRNDFRMMDIDNRSEINTDLIESMFSEEGKQYVFSKNRNRAILVSTENFCRKYHVDIAPIFHDLTDYEKECVKISNDKLYGNDKLRFKLKRPNTFENKDVLSICIQDFPDIIEDELSWEHIIDIRNDKQRNRQLRTFLFWTERNFNNMSSSQIRETIEREMEDYKSTLKFFGIKTTVGTFSTIVSTASSIASIINDSNLLFPLLSISSVTLGYTTNIYLEQLKHKKKPIAYVYNLENNKY